MASKTSEGKYDDGASMSALSDLMRNININRDDREQVLKKSIPTWLTNCESAFLWHSQMHRARSTDIIIDLCLEKLEELSLDKTDLSIRRYTVLLKLVVEYYVSDNQDQIKECFQLIKSCIKSDASLNTSQHERLKLVLDHVVFATESHLLALDGQEKQSKEIARKITPIDKMPNYSQAGLFAIKSNFFLYSGYENSEDVAVEMARKALELEPDHHEWLYLLAKVLRQQRREIPFNLDVPREELLLLEKAVKQKKNSKYLQYLAQIYRECAAQAHKQYRNKPDYFTSNLYKTTQTMNEKALSYYKEALELNPDNPANLRRTGYGIMNLPRNLADYDLALNCLLKSLNICENQNTLHILGTFYHRFGKDNKKALEYYERTVKLCSHAGLSDLIRVKFIENPEYDPCEDIENGLRWELRKKHRFFLLTQQGGYFLFIKRDFLKSIQYFNQVILEDKESLHLKVYKCIFLRMYDPINLYQYLANEALIYLEQNNSNSSEDEDFYEVMALIDTINNIHPELANVDPDPLLITKLLDKSIEITEKDRKDTRPQQHHLGHRGRGRGGGRIGQTKGNSYSKRTFHNDDVRQQTFSGNRRNTDDTGNNYEQNRYERGRGRSQNNGNRTPKNKFKSDEDSNWRRKD